MGFAPGKIKTSINSPGGGDGGGGETNFFGGDDDDDDGEAEFPTEMPKGHGARFRSKS
jgi:hypothetical protein